MRPVSDTYLATLRGSHTMRAQARVVAAGTTGTNPAGTELSIISGNVQLGTGDVRSTLDLTVDGTSLWPTQDSSPILAPYGAEVWVRRGVVVGGGSTEWVSLGYHRIQEIEQDRPPDGPIRITGQDRMAGLVEARLTTPVQFFADDTLGTVVDQLVTDVYPSATISWDDTTDDDLLGRSLVADDDRHAFIDDLIKARGKIWYWDHRGILVIKDPPTPTTPVWDVDAGASGVLVSAQRSLTREGVYNAVVASGQAADTESPSRAVVVDDNPDSPTYWGGTFGKVPRFYSSPFILADSQAQSAAESLLRQAIGLPYLVDLTAVPNAALEPYDPVRVQYSGTTGPEVHVLDTVTIPLTADRPLTATTREQTTVVLGVV